MLFVRGMTADRVRSDTALLMTSVKKEVLVSKQGQGAYVRQQMLFRLARFSAPMQKTTAKTMAAMRPARFVRVRILSVTCASAVPFLRTLRRASAQTAAKKIAVLKPAR